jgi:hypothetical protein
MGRCWLWCDEMNVRLSGSRRVAEFEDLGASKAKQSSSIDAILMLMTMMTTDYERTTGTELNRL